MLPVSCALKMEHIRTATVRDVRNRSTSLLRWLRAGEEILITRRGKPVARLVPEPAVGSGLVDWALSPAVQQDRTGARVLSADESATAVHDAAARAAGLTVPW